jgi:WD40 repeat protein
VNDSGRYAVQVLDAQSDQALTGPMKHGNLVYSAQFSPYGKRIVTASKDDTARVWNDSGVFEPRKEDPGRVLEETRAQLNRGPADGDWTILGHWLLADRSTRTISPFSKITVPEYIGNRIKENTPESLDEAERLSVGNSALLQRIANARAQLKKQEP